MFVHDMKNRVYMAPLSVKTSLDMNTNRDKAVVSFSRTAEMSAVPFFLSMSQSRMLHPFQLRGARAEYRSAGCVNNDKLRLSGYLFR